MAAVFLASCSRIDEVDINSFDQPDGGALNGTIAVFGNVTTEMRQHRVTISPVHQWGDNQNAMPEINRVFVLCGNDTIPYIEKEADPNSMTFISEQPFKGEVGKTCKLVIETPTGDITAEDYLTPLGNTDYLPIIKDHTKVRSYQMHSGKMAHLRPDLSTARGFPPVGFYEYMGQTVPIYTERNASRTPAYHRLDLSCAYHSPKYRNGFNWSASIGVFNAYNRLNPLGYQFETDIESGEMRAYAYSMFGILPNVSLRAGW